jgi:superfamily II DNA or RNA helicase
MLRPFQNNALTSSVEAYDAGIYHQLIAMATGTGKTVVFANLIKAMGHRIPGQMWVIAHREELIDQAVDKIRHWNPELIVDKEMAEYEANPFADVIVSCVASIGRKDTKRTERFDWNAVTIVVIDEAHHTPASTYMNFLQTCGFVHEVEKDGKKELVRNSDCKKLLIGVTATPQRGDGKALASIYDKIVYKYPIFNAIEDGWLVDLRCYRVYTRTSLDAVHTTAGDFQSDELSNAINTEERNKLVINVWREKGEGRRTIGFCVDIAHAQSLAETFRGCGIAAEAVWGNDPDRSDYWECDTCKKRSESEDRIKKACTRKNENGIKCGGTYCFNKGKLTRHKEGEFPVLLNCGVLTEGYDDWQIGCILLARPTKSGSLYTQMVGRGTRLEDGTGNLFDAIAAGVKLSKTDCILIDVCDLSTKHKLQTAPSLLGLDVNVDFSGRKALESVKEIMAAQAANPHIDFSRLDDITKLKTYIESVNLWQDREVPKEILEGSKLDWHKRPDGSYMLMLRSKEIDHFFVGGNKIPVYEQKTIYVKENILGKFEIISTIKTTKSPKQASMSAVLSKAEACSLEDALRMVDAKVIETGQDKYLTRNKQSSGPASDKQRAAVAGYYKKQIANIPFCLCPLRPASLLCTVCKKNNTLTSQQASNLIVQAQIKRRKGL